MRNDEEENRKALFFVDEMKTHNHYKEKTTLVEDTSTDPSSSYNGLICVCLFLFGIVYEAFSFDESFR